MDDQQVSTLLLVLDKVANQMERQADAMEQLAHNCGDYRGWLLHETVARGVSLEQAKKLNLPDLEGLARDLVMQETYGTYYMVAPQRSPLMPKPEVHKCTTAQINRMLELRKAKARAEETEEVACPMCFGTKVSPMTGEPCVLCNEEKGEPVVHSVNVIPGEPEEKLTIREVRKVAKECAMKHGNDKVRDTIVKTFNVRYFRDLTEENFGKAIEALQELDKEIN